MKYFFICSAIYLFGLSSFISFWDMPKVWSEERISWPSDFTIVTEPSLETIDIKSQGVASIDVSPDGKYLAAAGHDATLRIWKLENCELHKVIQLDLIDPSKMVFEQYLIEFPYHRNQLN